MEVTLATGATMLAARAANIAGEAIPTARLPASIAEEPASEDSMPRLFSKRCALLGAFAKMISLTGRLSLALGDRRYTSRLI